MPSVDARVVSKPPWVRENGFADSVVGLMGIVMPSASAHAAYDRQEAMSRSRPGDEAELCLISVPHDWPPAYDRGQFYAATSLRTRASWSLPDWQYVCGGA